MFRRVDSTGLLKESVAQIPHLKVLIREILILDGSQPYQSHFLHVVLELSSGNYIIIALEADVKSKMLGHIVKDRVEDDHQLFLEVDLLLTIDNLHVYRRPFL